MEYKKEISTQIDINIWVPAIKTSQFIFNRLYYTNQISSNNKIKTNVFFIWKKVKTDIKMKIMSPIYQMTNLWKNLQ